MFLPHADKSAWGFSYSDISDVAGEVLLVRVFDVVLSLDRSYLGRCRFSFRSLFLGRLWGGVPGVAGFHFDHYCLGVGAGLFRGVSVTIFSLWRGGSSESYQYAEPHADLSAWGTRACFLNPPTSEMLNKEWERCPRRGR